MRHKEPRLPAYIQTELEGLNWRWVRGTKHWKLMVGDHLVAIWPRGSAASKQTTDGRPSANMRAQIRRFRRQQAA